LEGLKQLHQKMRILAYMGFFWSLLTEALLAKLLLYKNKGVYFGLFFSFFVYQEVLFAGL